MLFHSFAVPLLLHLSDRLMPLHLKKSKNSLIVIHNLEVKTKNIFTHITSQIGVMNICSALLARFLYLPSTKRTTAFIGHAF